MTTTPKGRHGAHDLRKIICKLESIGRTLNRIERKQRIMGKVLDEVKKYAAEIDESSNEIERDLQALRDQLVDATTPEEVATVLAPISARLKALGQNPEAPPTPQAQRR